MTIIHSLRIGLLIFCVFLLIQSSIVFSQTIEVKKLETPPVIDGNVDDEIWKQITPIEEFRVAELETTVPDKTQIYIGYDNNALYVGFRCFQEASQMIANQTRRDGSFKFEDHVAIYIDTYHDKIRTYCFAVNPLGTQLDDKQGDIGWDGVWSAAALIDESVWTVEMKIPYKILDLPEKTEQSWGLNLVRRHQSLDRTSTWADTGVNVSDANRFGTLENLKFVHEISDKKYEVIGYLSTKYDGTIESDVGSCHK